LRPGAYRLQVRAERQIRCFPRCSGRSRGPDSLMDQIPVIVRRLVGVVIVGGIAVLATAGSVRASEIDRADSAFLKWVPVLMADQRALFSTTRTYLKNPDLRNYDGVLAVSDRMRKHVDQTQRIFGSIYADSDKLRRIRGEMQSAAGDFRHGLTYWNDFLHRYFADLRVGETSDLQALYKQHDTAERWFNWAWGRISGVNTLLGEPIGNQRTKPPPAPPAEPPEDPIVGDWNAGGGIARVTVTGRAAFEAKLIKTYSFCQSGNVPLGQVEWVIRRTAQYTYTGTVRYYRTSDCTYIGTTKHASWKYRLADDTLYSCSSSPNPSYPGGGCSVLTRAKRG
jgi:hypothetical protein